MSQSNSRLVAIHSSDKEIPPATALLTRTSYLIFGLLLMYVFTVMFVRNVSDLRLKLFIGGFFVLFFWCGSYYRQWINRVLNNIRLSHILLLAMAIRLAWVLSSGVEQTSDFASYDADARQIADGGKWINILRSSGAPLFYALHFKIFGHWPLVPQISLALLSTLQIYLVHGLASRTLGNINAGKIAALVMTFWPEHIIYNNLLCTEVPFSTLTLLAIWLLWPDARGYAWRVFLSGICLGAANWVRPNAPIFLVAMLLFVLLQKRYSASIWNRIRPAIIGFVGFAIMLMPIIFLNYRDFGIISIIPSQCSGNNLMFGTNLASHGNYYEPDCELVESEAARRGCPPNMNPCLFRNQIAREISISRLKDRPFQILGMAVSRKIPELWGYPAGLFWSFETSRFKDIYIAVFHAALAYQVIILGLSAWIVLRHRRFFTVMDERWIYVAAVLLVTLSHVILEVQPRYHHACLPILAICVGAYARLIGTNP
jgi:hypothetical protein